MPKSLEFESHFIEHFPHLQIGHTPSPVLVGICNSGPQGFFAHRPLAHHGFALEVGLLSITFISTASDPEASDKRIAPSNILPETKLLSLITISDCQYLFKSRACKLKVLMTETKAELKCPLLSCIK